MRRASLTLALIVVCWSCASAQTARPFPSLPATPTGGGGGGTPPTAISGPSPAFGATDVATTGSLTWSGCVGATAWTSLGPDTTNPPTTFTALAGNTKSYASLTASTTYYWKPTCANAYGSVTTALVLSFTTIAGPVPGTPTNPSPADGATGISTALTLSASASNTPTSWAILGPDATNPPTTNHAGLSSGSLAASGLSNSTTYYWKATATNGSGSTAGPVWSFTTTAGGSLATVSLSDVSWLGQYRVASNGNCWSGTGAYGQIAVRYVGGARHFLVGQDDSNGRFTPCEFLDTATYDSSGACTANCPSQTLASSPTLAFVGNWGYSKNGIAGGVTYDFWHGVLGKCYGNGSACNDLGTTALNDCAQYGGGGCFLVNMFVVPGSPDRVFFSMGPSYGAYHYFNFGFCELTTTPAAGVTDPVSTCYGPFNSETALRQIPSLTASSNYKGLLSAQYFLKGPDGNHYWGGAGPGASYQQGTGSAGPTLFKIDALPTTASVAGPSGATITASTKYLAYYNMACANPPTCTVAQLNYDGSMPGGNAIWAFRFYNYPYLWTGTPCAPNWNLAAQNPPGCTGPSGYVDTSDRMDIDPRQNSGIGTWGDTFRLGGCAWFQGTTKQGILCFGSGTLNHLAGNITTCSHAVGWYCNGQYKGLSGFTCAGGADSGFGHPGDFKDPLNQCTCAICETGPSSTMREAFILVFNPDDATAVAAGTKTDYTVDASTVIYPQSDFSSSFTLAPITTVGVGKDLRGVIQDPNNAHIIYVAAPQSDNATHPGYPDIVIHVFKIAG